MAVNCGSHHHSATNETVSSKNTSVDAGDNVAISHSESDRLPNLGEECTKAMYAVGDNVKNYDVYVKDDFLTSVGTCGSFRLIVSDGLYYFYGANGMIVGLADYIYSMGAVCKGYTYYGVVPTDCELKLERVEHSLWGT